MICILFREYIVMHYEISTYADVLSGEIKMCVLSVYIFIVNVEFVNIIEKKFLNSSAFVMRNIII